MEDVYFSDLFFKIVICFIVIFFVKVDECDKIDDDGGESSIYMEYVIEMKGLELEVLVVLFLDCFDEEDWEDSVKKCKYRELDLLIEGEDSYYCEYVEISDF